MGKRTLAALLALVFVAGGGIGGLIGFAWHAPGQPSTWTDVRNWVTLGVLVLGFSVAAYELNLQRKQFADQASRSAERDEVLAMQRQELALAVRSREREQAEQVDLEWDTEEAEPGSHIEVTTGSRPIRNVTARIQSLTDPTSVVMPDNAAEITDETGTGPEAHWLLSVGVPNAAGTVMVLKFLNKATFRFHAVARDDQTSRALVRFTDDGGLHWQLDNDMHLELLKNRDDW